MATKKRKGAGVAPSETEEARRARGKVRVQLSLPEAAMAELRRRGKAHEDGMSGAVAAWLTTPA
jgi:hypothetical protein